MVNIESDEKIYEFLGFKYCSSYPLKLGTWNLYLKNTT